MKKFFALVVVMIFFATTPVSAEIRIALIDLEKAMNTSEAGKKANAELKRELEKAQAKAQKLAGAIEKISKEIETQRGVLSQAAVQKKLADVQKKKIELERLEKDTSDDLQRKQMQLVGGIVGEMRDIIIAFAKEKKYDLILEAKEAGTAYSSPKLDITDEIVKRYNAAWKKRR